MLKQVVVAGPGVVQIQSIGYKLPGRGLAVADVKRAADGDGLPKRNFHKHLTGGQRVTERGADAAEHRTGPAIIIGPHKSRKGPVAGRSKNGSHADGPHLVGAVEVEAQGYERHRAGLYGGEQKRVFGGAVVVGVVIVQLDGAGGGVVGQRERVALLGIEDQGVAQAARAGAGGHGHPPGIAANGVAAGRYRRQRTAALQPGASQRAA